MRVIKQLPFDLAATGAGQHTLPDKRSQFGG